MVFLWAALIALAVGLDLWLLRAWRRRRRAGDQSREVWVGGTVSPILTWLKHRQRRWLGERSRPAVESAALGAPAEVRVTPTPEPAPSPEYPAARSDGGASVNGGASTGAGQPAAPARAALGAAWVPLLAAGLFILALAGQFFLAFLPQDTLDAALLLGLAGVLLLALEWRAAGGGRLKAPWLRGLLERVAGQPRRVVFVLTSVLLAYLTVRLMQARPPDGDFGDVIALWALSGAAYAAAFLPWPDFRAAGAWFRRHRLEIAGVALLTVAAAALRLILLGALPDVLSGDEGIIGVMVLSVLRGELHNPLIIVNNQGVLYLDLLALAVRLFGRDAFGLRFWAAISGTLTVPMLYVLARRMFNGRVAMLAAGLLLVSHFHLHLSRVIVASSIHDALFATTLFALIYIGQERRNLTYWVLGGLALGVFMYVYMGARLLVLFMPVYFAALWVVDRRTAQPNFGNFLAFAGALAVVVAPLAAWSMTYPDEFMSRVNQMGVIQSGWLANQVQATGTNQYLIIADLLRQAFLTVNYFPATVHYGSPYPMLDWVSGAAFLIGIVYSLLHVLDRRHLLLQGWFWAGMLVAGALVIVPSDNAYRIAIVFPAVCLFVALAVDRLLALAGRALPASARWQDYAPAALFLLPVAALNLKAYFVDFGPKCRYGDSATRFASFMGEQLAKAGPEYSAYLLGNEYTWYSIHKSVEYFSGGIPLVNVTVPDTAVSPLHYQDRDGQALFFDPAKKNIFFFVPERANEVVYLQALLPGGTVGERRDCGAPSLGYYQFDPSAAP